MFFSQYLNLNYEIPALHKITVVRLLAQATRKFCSNDKTFQLEKMFVDLKYMFTLYDG